MAKAKKAKAPTGKTPAGKASKGKASKNKAPADKTSKSREALAADVEDILGQFCYAFGAGASPVRVRRTTIRALRERYRGFIERAQGRDPGAWDREGAQVLYYMEIEGRLAAQLVVPQGRHAIDPRDFVKAATQVEAAADPITAGQWCTTG